jgi:hypothetical protein
MYAQRVRELIDEALDSGRVWTTNDLVAVAKHTHPFPAFWTGDDRDANEAAVDLYLHIEFRKKLREHKASDRRGDGRQALLPGYEFLQASYAIERDGEPCIVPVVEMTLGELLAKDAELAKMVRGLMAHRADLRRFITENFGPEAFAEGREVFAEAAE